MIFEYFHNVGNSGSLLTNGNIDAIQSSSFITVGVIEGSLLVDDTINSNSSFTSLTITNDKLSLTSTNGYLFKLN